MPRHANRFLPFASTRQSNRRQTVGDDSSASTKAASCSGSSFAGERSHTHMRGVVRQAEHENLIPQASLIKICLLSLPYRTLAESMLASRMGSCAAADCAVRARRLGCIASTKCFPCRYQNCQIILRTGLRCATYLRRRSDLQHRCRVRESRISICSDESRKAVLDLSKTASSL